MGCGPSETLLAAPAPAPWGWGAGPGCCHSSSAGSRSPRCLGRKNACGSREGFDDDLAEEAHKFDVEPGDHVGRGMVLGTAAPDRASGGGSKVPSDFGAQAESRRLAARGEGEEEEEEEEGGGLSAPASVVTSDDGAGQLDGRAPAEPVYSDGESEAPGGESTVTEAFDESVSFVDQEGDSPRLGSPRTGPSEASSSDLLDNISVVGETRHDQDDDDNRSVISETQVRKPNYILSSGVQSAALQIVVNSHGNIHEFYDVSDTVLGEGNFGTVRRAKIRITGAPRAVKTVSKVNMKRREQSLKQEVDVMRKIDHPNLVMLYDIFEDDENLQLVMELCVGGHLLDRVRRTTRLTEMETAVVMQQLLRAVSYLHKHWISHRDVKAENCLLAGREPMDRCRVKLGDFGLSCSFKVEQVFMTRVGTPSHWAPEVLDRKYTKACDIWSAGVVMYHCLSGLLPFSEARDCEEIRRGQVRFQASSWRNVSDIAKEMVLRLLTYDPNARPNAQEALKDEWFKKKVPKAQDAPFKAEHLRNLQTFRSLNRLQRAALTVITTMLGERDISAARRLFLSLDEDGDGRLSVVELKKRLLKSRKLNMKEEAMEGIFADSDVRSARTLKPFGYTEFLAATFSRDQCLSENLCKAAFRNFDKNRDGTISMSELAAGRLLGEVSLEDLAQLLEDIDANGDNAIAFDEFKLMMMRADRRKASMDKPGEVAAPAAEVKVEVKPPEEKAAKPEQREEQRPMSPRRSEERRHTSGEDKAPRSPRGSTRPASKDRPPSRLSVESQRAGRGSQVAALLA